MVMARRRADDYDLVPALNISGEFQKGRQMGVSAPYQNKMFSRP